MKNIYKGLYIIGGFGIITAIGFMSLLLFWVAWPYPTTEIEDPVEILNENNEIAIGDNIEMMLTISKPDTSVAVNTNFITCDDGNLVTLANIPQSFPQGDYQVEVDDYRLPPKVAVGSRCQFDFVKTYTPNPIRTQELTASSEEFVVVGGE